jgi:hypothetical protein
VLDCVNPLLPAPRIPIRIASLLLLVTRRVNAPAAIALESDYQTRSRPLLTEAACRR